MALEASVVIATYNRVHLLRKCIDALEHQSLDCLSFEVVIVDDGSSDGTVNFLESVTAQSPLQLRYFCQDNRGPAAARNKGIDESRAPFIAFTDDDCIPDAHWLERFLEEFPKSDRCAGLGGTIRRVNDTVAGRYIDHIGSMQPVKRSENDEVVYLVTANAMYRRTALQSIGGFDQTITWPGGEDPDLSYRLVEAGYFLAATDRAIVHHHHRDTLAGLYKTFWYYGRGKAARHLKVGVPLRIPSGLGLLRNILKTSMRYVVKSVDLPLIDRVGFGGLCWIHLLGFYSGCRSLPGVNLVHTRR